MKEWRRTLESWPTEKVAVADSSSLPEYQRDPRRLREAKEADLQSSLRAIAIGSLLPIGVGFAGTAWLASAGLEFAAALSMFGGMIAGMAGLFPMSKIEDERHDRLRRRRTLDLLEARGEATLGGEFVGIAYEERLWHRPHLGFDADAGVLTMGFDRLVFVGEATRFELPPEAILRTEIRVFDAAIIGARPRLFVHWARDGSAGAFNVSLPSQRSVDRRIEAILDLKKGLDAWRGELRLRGANATAILPPFEHPVERVSTGIGLPAKLLAAVATFFLLATIEIVASIIAIQMGWQRSGTLLMVLVCTCNLPWSILSRKIEKRLPARWQWHDSAQEEVREALRDSPVIVEEPPPTEVRQGI